MSALSSHTEKSWSPLAKGLLYFLAVILILSGPFLLRTGDPRSLMASDRRLVIVSPHDQRVRAEIGGAFVRYWKEKTGETIDIDWRIPGGSSEIFMLLKSEYLAAFRQLLETQGVTWSPEIASAFASSGSAGKGSIVGDKARSQFLESNVGIGIDVIFGGGATDFQQLADAGYLVAGQAETGTGIIAIRQQLSLIHI